MTPTASLTACHFPVPAHLYGYFYWSILNHWNLEWQHTQPFYIAREMETGLGTDINTQLTASHIWQIRNLPWEPELLPVMTPPFLALCHLQLQFGAIIYGSANAEREVGEKEAHIP